MLRILFSALMTLMVVVGCSGPNYVDYFPYHDDGTPKPRVALMPIIDSSRSGLPWSLSEEFSQDLYYNLMNNGELYVMSPAEVGPTWDKSIDLFNNDLSFTREFCNTDFIVALELVQHQLIPCDANTKGIGNSECHSYNRQLSVGIRARVIDIRRPQPRVILYEILKNGYLVAPPYDIVNFANQPWKSNGYPTSPCGVVHQRLINDLVLRLEDVIQSAR